MKGQKILIVEDDLSLNDIYRIKFESLGFTVLIAPNGQEGLSELAKALPDIILLDLLMPKMDGFQFLANIRKNPAWKNIPVIVSSNLGRPEGIKRALEMGAEEYFVKPNVSIDDVVDTVQKVVRIHS